jgi:hypothetical protein
LKPVLRWQDDETGNTGAEYFVNYIKDGVATKSEVQTVETLTEKALTETQTNAKGIQSLVSSVDRYSVGEFSQAYGLTQEQASNILKNDMIYIPMVEHSETYVIDEDNGLTQNFTSGYYYTWIDNKWIESDAPLVAFSGEVPAGGSVLKYWYVNSDTAPEGYEAYALYIWKDEHWVKVNILDGNVNNRITSMIRQTADTIALEVTNARGSAATLGARITDNESSIESLALWAGGKENQYNLATIQQAASDDGAELALVVIDKDGDKVLHGANIILGANDNDSYIKIDANRIDFTAGEFSIDAKHIDFSAEDFKLNANKIDFTGDDFTIDAKRIKFEGETSFLTAADLGETGTTTIHGSRIETGTITAKQIAADSITTSHLAPNSVTGAIIVDGAVTMDKLAVDVVTVNQLTTENGGILIEGSNIKAGTIKVEKLESTTAGLVKFNLGIDLGGNYYIFGSDYTGTPAAANLDSIRSRAITITDSFGGPGISCSKNASNNTNKGTLSGTWLYGNSEIATLSNFNSYVTKKDFQSTEDYLDGRIDNLTRLYDELLERVNLYHT